MKDLILKYISMKKMDLFMEEINGIVEHGWTKWVLRIKLKIKDIQQLQGMEQIVKL